MNQAARTPARPIQACYQCRKRKIKCNREYPCLPCKLRGEGAFCQEVHDPSPPVNLTLTSLHARLQVVEEILRSQLHVDLEKYQLGSSSKADDDKPLKRRRMVEGEGDVAGSGPSPPRISAAVSSATRLAEGDEEAAMMLEGFAMGWQSGRHQSNGVSFEESRPSSPTAPAIQFQTASVQSTLHPLAPFIDPGVNVMDKLLTFMPPEDQCRRMLDFYFARLDWYTHIFHVPSFWADVDLIFEAIRSRQTNRVRLNSLTLLYAVLALAYHLIERTERENADMSVVAAVELAQQCYSASRACLQYSNFYAYHHLEHLQAIILFGVYQQNTGGADTHWSLLGSSIKAAQNIGLCRLGSEEQGRVWPSRWSSLVKREVGRRVWWSLIFADWSHSFAHHLTYSIHPDQFDTAFPMNVNDSELTDDMPIRKRPLSQYSEMSLFIWRCHFIQCDRQVVDNANSVQRGSAEFVAEMNTRLATYLPQVQETFRLVTVGSQPSDVIAMQHSIALITCHDRRMRLNRPLLLKGVNSENFAMARYRCVASALEIIRLLTACPILLKWWTILHYGFTAAIILFVDLCLSKDNGEPNILERRNRLREVTDLLKTMEHISTAARNAIMLLDGLLDAEAEMVTPSAHTRGGSASPSFQTLVSQLLETLETSSGRKTYPEDIEPTALEMSNIFDELFGPGMSLLLGDDAQVAFPVDSFSRWDEQAL